VPAQSACLPLLFCLGTHGNWADDTWKFTSGDTRKFSVHSSSFPSVVQHHGMSPRWSLSVHYPKNLGPRFCSTCQRSQRASATQCVVARKRQKKVSSGEGCPAAVNSTLSLGSPTNITSDQPVFLSAVSSAREHAGIHLRGLREWASLYEDSAAYIQWIWRRGVSLLLSFATWRAVEGVHQLGDAKLLRDLDMCPGTAHSKG